MEVNLANPASDSISVRFFLSLLCPAALLQFRAPKKPRTQSLMISLVALRFDFDSRSQKIACLLTWILIAFKMSFLSSGNSGQQGSQPGLFQSEFAPPARTSPKEPLRLPRRRMPTLNHTISVLRQAFAGKEPVTHWQQPVESRLNGAFRKSQMLSKRNLLCKD